MPTVEALLTVEETAQRLRISPATVRSYIRSGLLPAERLAGARLVRIREAAVDALRVPIQPRGSEGGRRAR